MKSPHYSGDVTKHQEYAQTGKVEGLAHGGHVSTHENHPSSHRGGHTSMKQHGAHHGHGTHGHKHPHEHHTNPGAGHSGHDGHGIHSLVHDGKNTPEHTMHTHSHGIETDGGGGKHNNHASGGSTGTTRNRI